MSQAARETAGAGPGERDMTEVVRHDALEEEVFPGGATYRTLVGDDAGSTPVRCGIQTSPPGYATPEHAHPYMEVLTVLSGAGEAWAEDRPGPIDLAPGVTLVFRAGRAHGFRVTGDAPLVTYGVHASPDRIVEIRGGRDQSSGMTSGASGPSPTR